MRYDEEQLKSQIGVEFDKISKDAFLLNPYYFHPDLDWNTEPIEYEAGIGVLTSTSQYSIGGDRNRFLVKT